MTAQDHEELMIKKLRQCSVPFDFMDPMAELKGKEIKRDTLNELVDYISTSRGVLSENLYPEIIKMVCKLYIYIKPLHYIYLFFVYITILHCKLCVI